MKIFLDTNILIDFLSDRGSFTKYATKLFLIANANDLKLYTSSHSIATTYYILKKYTDEKSLRKKLIMLLDFMEILDVTKNHIKKALLSELKDFEDGIQVFNAVSTDGIEYIITRNLKDFKGSPIPAITSEELLRMINNK